MAAIFNIRFWQYYFFITGPVWVGIIAIGIMIIRERIERQEER